MIGVSKELQKAIGFKSQALPLSHSQATSLLVINSDEQISQAQIAQRLHLEPASVVTLVDELEKLKLVDRAPVANNRRQYQIQLTQKGKLQAQKIDTQSKNLERFINQKLTKSEAKSFMNSLDKLLASLNTYKLQNTKREGVNR